MTLQEVFSWNLVSNDEIYTRIFFFLLQSHADEWFLIFVPQIDSIGWIGWVHGLPIPWEDKLMQARERGITYNPKDTGQMPAVRADC